VAIDVPLDFVIGREQHRSQFLFIFTFKGVSPILGKFALFQDVVLFTSFQW
jgi:hypothetical protein